MAKLTLPESAYKGIPNAAKGSINLHYGYCNTWVHYKVVKVGSENGPRVKERMKESDDDRYM